MWGLDQYNEGETPEKTLLLEGRYLIGGDQIQTFPVAMTTDAAKVVQYVMLEILSNHGAEWTCVYRFRVHSKNSTCRLTQN